MKLIYGFCILLVFTFLGCSENMAQLQTVKDVDLQRYSGTWYEIARFDHSFERGLKCVTATYTLRNDGDIGVLNKGVKENDTRKISEANGKAWIPDKNEPGKLKVQFLWPFRADYYIAYLDTVNYDHVIIGTPSRNYLWIMSRQPFMDKDIYNSLVDRAKQMGFDVSKLLLVKHDCN